MAMLTTLIGSKPITIDSYSSAKQFMLDTVYRDNALLLSDTLAIWGMSFNFPVPILGFTYEHPSAMELLKYEYSEYPYLNKTLITNSYMKQNTSITLHSYRGITAINGVLTNILLNEAFYKGIEAYCDRGGTFTLMTMWGVFNNLVLETLQIIPVEGSQVGGIGFEWQFKRIPFDTANAKATYSSSLNALSQSLVS